FKSTQNRVQRVKNSECKYSYQEQQFWVAIFIHRSCLINFFLGAKLDNTYFFLAKSAT
ncbi:hypothetical protein KI387_029162, partial [Taxus chinensis]